MPQGGQGGDQGGDDDFEEFGPSGTVIDSGPPQMDRTDRFAEPPTGPGPALDDDDGGFNQSSATVANPDMVRSLLAKEASVRPMGAPQRPVTQPGQPVVRPQPAPQPRVTTQPMPTIAQPQAAPRPAPVAQPAPMVRQAAPQPVAA